MKQQTAVEWYRQEIMKVLFASDDNTNIYENDIHEQALAMEQEQHSNTWADSRTYHKGDDYIGKEITFDEYFKQVYRK